MQKNSFLCQKLERLILTGTKGFDFAQITNGGIPLDEIHDYQSTKIKNLYICGEILDKQFPAEDSTLDFAWQSRNKKQQTGLWKKKNDTINEIKLSLEEDESLLKR